MRGRVARLASTIAMGALMVATFLPWAHSGRRAIHAHDAAALAHRLGLLSMPWLRLVPVVPLALAVSLLLRWMRRPVAAVALAAVAAAYTLAAAIGTWIALSPSQRGGGLVLAGSAAVALLATTVGEIRSTGWADPPPAVDTGVASPQVHGGRRIPAADEREDLP